MPSSDSSPNVSDACYDVMPFSVTRLLAAVSATVCWQLCGPAGDSLFVGVCRKESDVVECVRETNLNFKIEGHFKII